MSESTMVRILIAIGVATILIIGVNAIVSIEDSMPPSNSRGDYEDIQRIMRGD